MKRGTKKKLQNFWQYNASTIVWLTIAAALMLLGGRACSKCTEPIHHDYPYHNVETGKGQYEYGGSEEQAKDIINADKYMTDEEKAREKEYEEQVERELREMENH